MIARTWRGWVRTEQAARLCGVHHRDRAERISPDPGQPGRSDVDHRPGRRPLHARTRRRRRGSRGHHCSFLSSEPVPVSALSAGCIRRHSPSFVAGWLASGSGHGQHGAGIATAAARPLICARFDVPNTSASRDRTGCSVPGQASRACAGSPAPRPRCGLGRRSCLMRGPGCGAAAGCAGSGAGGVELAAPAEMPRPVPGPGVLAAAGWPGRAPRGGVRGRTDVNIRAGIHGRLLPVPGPGRPGLTRQVRPPGQARGRDQLTPFWPGPRPGANDPQAT